MQLHWSGAFQFNAHLGGAVAFVHNQHREVAFRIAYSQPISDPHLETVLSRWLRDTR